MPPLPSTPSDLHPSIARRLDDIETYQIPRLAKCTGPVGLQRELADETKIDLDQVRRNIEVCLRPLDLTRSHDVTLIQWSHLLTGGLQLCKELGEGLKTKERQENATICHAFHERYQS